MLSGKIVVEERRFSAAMRRREDTCFSPKGSLPAASRPMVCRPAVPSAACQLYFEEGKDLHSRSYTAAEVTRILLFIQPGCLSCELMRIYLEAREVAFEEHDISISPEDRRAMTETYGSAETPTLVIVSGETTEVVTGFDPELLDQLLDPAPSSDSVPGT